MINNFFIEKLDAGKVDEVFEIEKNLIGNADKENILSTIDNETLSYYVMTIEANGEKVVVGFFECLFISPEAELYDIAVKKEFQRNGFAFLMLNYFEKLAKENDCHTLLLEVNKINKPAINLYEKAGYLKYNERKNYYGDNDAILMKKEI